MKKSNTPKPRFATRFKKHGQKSKKVRKGPQTHLGPLTSKEPDLMDSAEVHNAPAPNPVNNPLIQAAKSAPQAVPTQQMVRTTGRGG